MRTWPILFVTLCLSFVAAESSAAVAKLTFSVQTETLTTEDLTSSTVEVDDQQFMIDVFLDEADFRIEPSIRPDGNAVVRPITQTDSQLTSFFAANHPAWSDRSAMSSSPRAYIHRYSTGGINTYWGDYTEDVADISPDAWEVTERRYDETLRINYYPGEVDPQIYAAEADTFDEMINVFRLLETTGDQLNFFHSMAHFEEFTAHSIGVPPDEPVITFYESINFDGTAQLISVSMVPLPATIWLFGSTLGLLGWMRRKAT